MPTGYLADSFDLLNVRDLDLIAQVRDRCDRVLLGVYSDDYAEHLTGRRPVVPLSERIALLEHVRGVDGVSVHDPSFVSVAPDVMIFFAAGPAVPEGREAVLLSPRRATEGAILRRALAHLERSEPAA